MNFRCAVGAMLVANVLMLLAPPLDGPKSLRVVMPRRTLAEMHVFEDVSLFLLLDSREAHPEAVQQAYLTASIDRTSANPPSALSAASSQAN